MKMFQMLPHKMVDAAELRDVVRRGPTEESRHIVYGAIATIEDMVHTCTQASTHPHTHARPRARARARALARARARAHTP